MKRRSFIYFIVIIHNFTWDDQCVTHTQMQSIILYFAPCNIFMFWFGDCGLLEVLAVAIVLVLLWNLWNEKLKIPETLLVGLWDCCVRNAQFSHQIRVLTNLLNEKRCKLIIYYIFTVFSSLDIARYMLIWEKNFFGPSPYVWKFYYKLLTVTVTFIISVYHPSLPIRF